MRIKRNVEKPLEEKPMASARAIAFDVAMLIAFKR
jgi:hypothetical protein